MKFSWRKIRRNFLWVSAWFMVIVLPLAIGYNIWLGDYWAAGIEVGLEILFVVSVIGEKRRDQ